MTARTARIDELLRQEIGQALARDLSDPAIGFATVTEVETTPDLSHAQVRVSVIGPQAERSATLAALQRAMPHVRRQLGRTLHLRRIPEFHVTLDDSMERGTRVLRILQELEEGNVPEPPEEGESLPTPVPRLHQPGDADEPQPEAAEAKPTAQARSTRQPRRGTGARTGAPHRGHRPAERRQGPGRKA